MVCVCASVYASILVVDQTNQLFLCGKCRWIWRICDKEEVSEKYNLTIIYFLSTPSQGQYIFNASTMHDYLGVSQTYGNIGRTVTGVHTFCHYEKCFIGNKICRAA